MARAGSSRRAARVSYADLSLDDSDEADESYLKTTRQSTRASRGTTSLRELSTDEDEDGDDADSTASEELVELRPTKRKAPVRPVARRTRAKTQQKSPVVVRRRRSDAKSRTRAKKRKTPQARSTPLETDGISPAWQTLPYEVVHDIFSFALDLYAPDDPKATSWLLGAARACRAFAEPALSALYREPRLLRSTKIELFFGHITNVKEDSLINYNSKVQRLNLDTRFLGNDFDLSALLRHLPRLTFLNLWSSKDTILRGNPSTANERYWQPPADLVQILTDMAVPLKSWHWNMRMMPISASVPLAERWSVMYSLQSQNILNKIQHLTLTNFDYATREHEQFLDTRLATLNMSHASHALEYLPDLDVEVELEEALVATDPLSDLIKSSTGLESVRFDHCNVVQGSWLLRLLPLRRLEIDCADYLTSWHIERYLQSHGHLLQRLQLDHNPTLNLNFLSSLKSSCPKLEELSMDLVYSNPHRFNEVIPANFDEMLNPLCVPTWPDSLWRLQLLHLKVSSEAAVVLFDSIMDASSTLRDLRQLSISASVDLDWRERTTFRDKWTSEFERVFLRVSEPPSPHLASGKAYRLWKASKTRAKAGPKSTADAGHHRLSNSARDDPGLSLRHRIKAALETTTRIQPGLCDIVDIRIDNARPRENEFRESDFLDSEQSGDEDYSYASE